MKNLYYQLYVGFIIFGLIFFIFIFSYYMVKNYSRNNLLERLI